MGVDANQFSVVSDSIKDWIRTDGPQPPRSERAIITRAGRALLSKEAPIDDMSELLLVKDPGSPGNLLWGRPPRQTNEPAQFQHKTRVRHGAGADS